MSKRGYLISVSILLFLAFGTWFAYEKYWEYRVKKKAFGYELTDEEVKYWVKRIRSYNKLDGFDEDIENFVATTKSHLLRKMNFIYRKLFN